MKLKGVPNPRQEDFFMATARHIAYGGARGGGKSWAMRRKFVLLALKYAGLRLLLLRRTLPELRENHVLPLMAELAGFAKYREDEKAFILPNGSRIKLGYCDTERDVYQYQGQEYDVIGLEEATHFTESQKDFLTTCNRSTRTDFKPRMYYTANPGNVGHTWFKRLFIDRDYRGSERPEDYVFIPARVYDNKVLMDTNPEYVQTLENLPEDLRRAHLEGDWDVFAGQYFPEFSREIHVIEPFDLPGDWRRYITIDYGLDMLAAYWVAVDGQNKAYVYKELYQSDLIISEASKRIKEVTGKDKIYCRYAPPDLWNRRQETGKSAADLFRENGVSLVKANNDRVQGWYNLKEWLKPYDDEQGVRTAHLVIFKNCVNLIRCLPQLQRDEKDPNDVATEPHELTHGPDAIRYFIAGRPKPNAQPKPEPHYNFECERPKPRADAVTVTESFFKGGFDL
jgi:phage terminase large subunit